MAGCVDDAAETVEPDRLPSPEPTVLELLPTPTLAPGVPTPLLPTPPITPTAEPDDAQAAAAEKTESGGPTGPPTATPEISQRLTLGNEALIYGDYATVIEQLHKALQQEPTLEPDLQSDALYKLGVAYLAEGQFDEAATMFNQLLNLPGEEAPSAADFHLAQASVALGDYVTAVEAYNSYLEANPDTAAYIYPLIAESYLALGDSELALEAYESALSGASNRLKAY